MSLAELPVKRADESVRRRIRNRALLLTGIALCFYFGFIALTIYRSHR